MRPTQAAAVLNRSSATPRQQHEIRHQQEHRNGDQLVGRHRRQRRRLQHARAGSACRRSDRGRGRRRTPSQRRPACRSRAGRTAGQRMKAGVIRSLPFRHGPRATGSGRKSSPVSEACEIGDQMHRQPQRQDAGADRHEGRPTAQVGQGIAPAITSAGHEVVERALIAEPGDRGEDRKARRGSR